MTEASIPAILIGHVRYLPLVRYQLAPYGTEWVGTNHFSGSGWPSRVVADCSRLKRRL